MTQDTAVNSPSVHGRGHSGGAQPPPRSPRHPQVRLRRSRMDSNDSEHSSGSGVSQDSGHLNPAPAIHLIPGSAPASRASSFREGQRPPTSRRSPSRKSGGSGGGSSNSNISSSNNAANSSSSSSSNNNKHHVAKNASSDETNGESLGPRRSSMPNVTENFLTVPHPDDAKDNRLRRVRSFKTTSKGGVVNRGDSFKKKSTHSLMSTGSAVTDLRQQQQQQQLQQQQQQQQLQQQEQRQLLANMVNNNLFTPEAPPVPTYYRVIMMGAAGTGKSQMAKQFMTSDFVGGTEDSSDAHENTVTVLLDGEESTIEFIDPLDRNVIDEGLCQLLDAYVVVFSINDHSSFDQAQELVRYLRVEMGTDRVIVLVANKIDLVRKRKVTADEARLVAETYDCKYTETSAALNHYVDELLVGILTQIRLHMRIPFTTISFPGKEQRNEDGDRKEKPRSPMKGPRGFFAKLFRRSGRKKLKPCENLYTL
ncbi:GTP-binding protein GEM [Aplysia californica]|uniref:GTP-binding protein GEM n=1 Tax=Aplysia californica TaxID=6500 RepID=A0ABM0JC76_APLCA|nr:GTP-binding protein GEM [Aplysia californica]XP_005090340.1 GTP-binding protein GEM [Aplysia californica]XP_035826936.1 GTP-binding protein GEM [Aplysia californica]